MTWTTATPSKPGWYWYRLGNTTPMIVKIEYGKVWATGVNGGGSIGALDGHWQGPITPEDDVGEADPEGLDEHWGLTDRRNEPEEG